MSYMPALHRLARTKTDPDVIARSAALAQARDDGYKPHSPSDVGAQKVRSFFMPRPFSRPS